MLQNKLLFYEWLALQAPCNDVIGDLAKYLFIEPNISALNNDLDDWHCYLQSRAASPIKLMSLRLAWYSYLRTVRMREFAHPDLPNDSLWLHAARH